MDNDKFIPGLAAKAAGNAVEGISRPSDKDNSGVFKFLLVVCAILFISGTEPLKVLLRKNIGKGALGLKSVVIASLAYMTWAYYIYHQIEIQNYEVEDYTVFLVTIFFYGLLGIGVLIASIMEYMIGSYDNYNYRGDSIVFSFLLNSGFSQKVVWALIEPITCMAIGGLLTMVHIYLGLPLLITSIAFFLNEIHKVYIAPHSEEQEMQRTQAMFQQSQNTTTTDKEVYNNLN